MQKLPAVVLSVTALAFGLAACGGSSSSSSAASSPAASSSATSATSSAAAPSGGAASGSVSESADPSGQLKFTKTALSAKAGKVTISFTNSSPTMHNMTIQQGTSGPVVGATPTFNGGTKTLTVNLKAGTYTFYCSVPGHRAAGMQGTITVS